jgi:hypothetical protein
MRPPTISTLEPIMNWDMLGMRGTCSSGFTLKGSGGIGPIADSASGASASSKKTSGAQKPRTT